MQKASESVLHRLKSANGSPRIGIRLRLRPKICVRLQGHALLLNHESNMAGDCLRVV